MPASAAAAPAIRALGAEEAAARLPELAALLVDAVAHGASINFMAGLDEAAAAEFWRGQVADLVAPGAALPGVALSGTGGRTLLVAEIDGRIAATVVLTPAPQPNAPHRAEIGKMLVHSSARRRGLGGRMLAAAEDAARAAGRCLLLLDTETGSAGEALYRARGWIEFGRVPGHAYRPDGRLAETTLFRKYLGGSPRRPSGPA